MESTVLVGVINSFGWSIQDRWEQNVQLKSLWTSVATNGIGG